MASIGIVSGSIEKGFVGQLITLSIKAPIEIRPNRGKASDVQPDYRVWSDGVEIGAGWIRVAEQSGRPYVSLSLATPEFGPRRILILFHCLPRLLGCRLLNCLLLGFLFAPGHGRQR